MKANFKINRTILISLLVCLMLFFSCSSKGKHKPDELLNSISQSWGKIHSGAGSYEYKYMNVTHLLLNCEDLKKSKRKIDEFYKLNPEHTSGVRSIIYKSYLFSGNRFSYDSVTNDGGLEISDNVSFDGTKFKQLSSVISLFDSLTGNSSPKGYIFSKPMVPKIELDPLYIPHKELSGSLSASKEKRVNISSYEIDKNDKNKYLKVSIKTGDSTEHSLGGFPKEEISSMIDRYKSYKISAIKNENFNGENYTVVMFKARGTKKKFYIDPQRDYRVFYITEQSRNEDRFTKIDYQTVDGLLFPKHIESYLVLDGIINFYTEINFNYDWKLNIPTSDDDFEIIFPKGIQIIEDGKIIAYGS